MYPANPAALLSYLVLCLIECDMLWRQKSRLIQSNKLPWARRPMLSEGAAACHSANRSLLTLSFDGLVFENSLSKRSADLKSQDSEFFMAPASLAAFWSFCHEWLTGGTSKKKKKKQKVWFCCVVPFYTTANKERNGDNGHYWIPIHVYVHFKSPSTLTPTRVVLLW